MNYLKAFRAGVFEKTIFLPLRETLSPNTPVQNRSQKLKLSTLDITVDSLKADVTIKKNGEITFSNWIPWVNYAIIVISAVAVQFRGDSFEIGKNYFLLKASIPPARNKIAAVTLF
jgi:hypothetical protein